MSENNNTAVSRFEGEFSVVFNDMISEHEVNLVYVYLKNKFNNFYVDSIECSRRAVNVRMNYTTNDAALGLDTLFDQIKALDPNKIACITADDGDLVILPV